MATILQRFQTWIFESRSFLFSWYTKDRDRIQEPTKSLVELPPALRKDLIATVNKLSNNPTDIKAIRSCISESFEHWRDCPDSSNNSIVLLTSPVMIVSRIIIEIIETWAEQEQVSVNILPWNGRPKDLDSIQTELREYVKQKSPKDCSEQIEVMVIPNLAWCFLRSMDGLDGIDYLQKMLLHDASRFWVIATGQITWDYLNSITDIEADCGRVFTLSKLESDSLQQWLKPVVSELKIAFADPDLESRIINGDRDNETIYFDDLTTVSEGVSVIALQAFLASIVYEVESEKGEDFGILKAQSPELPKLPDLNPIDHYILYFLLLHSDITLSALAYSISDRESRIRKQIKFLREEGLVEEQNEVLKVNPIYYPNIKQELINNNFVINDN